MIDKQRIARRGVLGVAGVGAGLPLLSACGGQATESAASDTPPISDGAAPSPSADEGLESTSSGISADDVPVEGGIIIDDTVITQPAEGDFRAFSAICTHQGCTVTEVEGTINCPCHGGKFDLDTGEPVAGAPRTALAARQIAVQDGQLVITDA